MTQTTPASGRGAFTRRRLQVGFTVAVLALAGAAAVLASRPKAEPDKAAPPLQFKGAEVTRPLLVPMPQRVEFSGPLVAPQTAIVKAKAVGTLLALDTAEGRRVKAGQLLGRIDLADLNSRVEDRAASVESAQAMLAEALRLHESNLRLSEQNFISPNALQSSQAKLDAARAQLRSMQAQLSSMRIGLREAALVAPIAGIVGKRHVVPGEKLSAEQPVLTLVDLTTLELVGTVSTHAVSLLAVGQPVTVGVEGRAEPVAGRIDRIAPQAEAGTRAIAVVVTIANADERLRAGQYAQAQVLIDDPTPRLTVPVAALSQASGQDQVWTIEHGALVRRIVITGRRDDAGGRIEVLKGLAPEADLLALRFENLKEGAQARFEGAPGPVAPAAAGAGQAQQRSRAKS
ncbi:MAG TPA: efflux RND transporter periplasmic adaptor subunit [Methylibium sp.]|uniref:efflux RND transporter periplasmic adaptor subunit n=1 Tax=Methylibium sp. TaxID=2067992 RepID=UPI002DB9C525|nr:efflux RND transporter periplasmic adaptor subunit [Methylibium sp.]HEU4459642.1 efflux RND transporter periplasmic adaptor subunit [Methylibium sp.]